jgi:hypothetical protein
VHALQLPAQFVAEIAIINADEPATCMPGLEKVLTIPSVGNGVPLLEGATKKLTMTEPDVIPVMTTLSGAISNNVLTSATNDASNVASAVSSSFMTANSTLSVSEAATAPAGINGGGGDVTSPVTVAPTPPDSERGASSSA